MRVDMNRLTQAAEERFGELLNEARFLGELFPHLRDAFDEGDLPLPFILASGAGRTAVQGRRPALLNDDPRPQKDAPRRARLWADRRKGQKG